MAMNNDKDPDLQYNFSHGDKRSIVKAMWYGSKGQCPSCGDGALFSKYLKVNNNCPNCQEELFHHQADDAPPYFTILILGHIIVPIVIAVESTWQPPLWLHALIWFPTTIALSLVFLQITKGAIIGLQWALKMHGFDNDLKKNQHMN